MPLNREEAKKLHKVTRRAAQVASACRVRERSLASDGRSGHGPFGGSVVNIRAWTWPRVRRRYEPHHTEGTMAWEAGPGERELGMLGEEEGSATRWLEARRGVLSQGPSTSWRSAPKDGVRDTCRATALGMTGWARRTAEGGEVKGELRRGCSGRRENSARTEENGAPCASKVGWGKREGCARLISRNFG
jgi:hypothetical protein